MSAEEVKSLVDGWVKSRLDRDEEVRIASTSHDIEAHYAEQLASFGDPLGKLTCSDTSDAKPVVDALIAGLGLQLSERDYAIALRLMMRAQLDLFRALVARHSKRWRPFIDLDPAQGLLAKISDAPTFRSSPTPSIKLGRLSEVAAEAIRDLARTEGWRPKRAPDYQNAVETFIQALEEDPDLSEITREIAVGWMRDLTRYPTNPTKRLPYRDLATFAERVQAVEDTGDENVLSHVTINGKYLTPMRRIFEWKQASRPDLANPFANVRVKKPRMYNAKSERRDFSHTEIIRLFGLPMFTGSQGSEGPKLYRPGATKIDDWRNWVPLICFFSGMRLNEACGLACQDVSVMDGISFLHVRDEVEGQSLKSISARRKVPIHPELMRVGFLSFVERQRAAGRIRLFENLIEDSNGYFSTVPSKFFGRVIDRIEDDIAHEAGELVFHSTRHTVTTRLRAANVRVDVAKEIVGHEKGDVHSGYGSYPLPLLLEAISKIEYPGLNLSGVERV